MLFVLIILLPVAVPTLSSSITDSYVGFRTDIDGDDVIVDTESGKLRGKRRPANQNAPGSERYGHVDWFLGVQFAQPPVGELRFMATQPVRRWDGLRNALRYSKICPQGRHDFWFNVYDNQDEDCLYLNIYSPISSRSDDEDEMAVMVYIHGGSYRVGTGAVFVGDVLAQQGVVVVTVNYRLGILGFLSSGTQDLPGNYGLLDQIEALSWIQTNIRGFRGDPTRVTIFGNSAGGASVGLLSASPVAKGLFQQTIAQSGSALSFWACHNTSVDFDKFFRQVASISGCHSGAASSSSSSSNSSSSSLHSKKGGIENTINRNNSSDGSGTGAEGKELNQRSIEDLANCMRRLPWSFFITDSFESSTPKISSENTDFKPVVDGVVLPRSPRDLFSSQAATYAHSTYERCSREGQGQGSAFHIKALMTGLIEDELSKHMGGLFLNVGFHEDDPTIDRSYGNGFDRSTFEKAIRHVISSCFGHDELVSEIVLSQYTNWSSCDDPLVNRYKYIEFLTDMSMLTPTVELAGYASDAGVPTYLYLLKLVDKNPRWTDNHHEMELSYVFGGPFNGKLIEHGLVNIFTDQQRLTSRRLMALWTNFAKYGNPRGSTTDTGSSPGQAEEDFRWNSYQRTSPDYLRFHPETAWLERDLKPDRVTLWSRLIPSAVARLNKLKAGGESGGEGDRACLVGVIVATACAVVVLVVLVIVIIVLVARDKRRNLR